MSEQLPTALPNDPMAWAQAWLTEATERAVQPNPNAMTLATATAAGEVSARIVLCKSFVADPGYLVFYSNYESRKGREIAENSRVSALFHWDQLGRQIRLEGTAVRSPAAESDEYFASRHRGSQLGAWGSDQSRPIESRDALKQQLAEREAALFADRDDADVPRPPHWGGFRLWPNDIELWIDAKDRIHDRARWTREVTPGDEHSFDVGPWSGSRLQP